MKRIILWVLMIMLLWAVPAGAASDPVLYFPDVTGEMTEASYWTALHPDAQNVILTPDQIKEYNRSICAEDGNMVMDLKSAAQRFDGTEKNRAIVESATADARYYLGWTYLGREEKASWEEFEPLIENCVDPKASSDMAVRYGIVVNHTLLQVFPSQVPIWDDPKDRDFDYESLSSVKVNEPLLIYTTSADGKYYLARSAYCPGWVAAEDVAICADRAQWLDAWDHPSEELLVVYGNKVYTDASNTAPEVSCRMLTQGTKLERFTELQPDQLVNNRSAFHNHVVYLPVRREDGSYEKRLALIPEKAKAGIGYLPLTQENIIDLAFNSLGNAYGWGGMLDAEDCSGYVRSIYACFGLTLPRNGTWQWNMDMEKVDLTNASLEEKLAVLDRLPAGAELFFPGHVMLYLGKVDGKYYVVNSASSVMSPFTGNRLRSRDVAINTLDVRRANGKTWLAEINRVSMPAYGHVAGKTYDFPSAAWYHDGVAYCLEKGLIDQREDGFFGVSDDGTRAVVVAALWRLHGSPAADHALPFTDVAEDAWYAEAVSWAAAEGIVSGYPDGTFRPQEPLTREQTAAIFYRDAVAGGRDVSVGESTNILSYDDAFSVAEYAVPAFQWACGEGIMKGTTESTLEPKGRITRAQLAVMVQRAGTDLT